jgi:hypothetical protein
MSDKRIDADEAFDQLTQLSQHTNMKPRDVARRLVQERTGTEPSQSGSVD